MTSLEKSMTRIRKSNPGRRGLAALAALLAGVPAFRAAALPSYGIVDCAECHSTALSGMTLTNYQAMVDLGLGPLPVFQASPGQTAALAFNVTNNNGGPYALNVNGLGAAGISNSTDYLVYGVDTNWTSQASGAYYTVGPILPSVSIPGLWTFNLAVDTGTPPDYYPLQVRMAGASSSMWSQAQSFYLQVLPAPVALAPVAAGGSFSVQVATTTGLTYYLEYRTGLGSGTWTPAAQTAGDGTVKTLTDPAATDPQRFYRVRAQ